MLCTCLTIGRAVHGVEAVNQRDDHVLEIDGTQTVSAMGASLLQVVIENSDYGFFLYRMAWNGDHRTKGTLSGVMCSQCK